MAIFQSFLYVYQTVTIMGLGSCHTTRSSPGWEKNPRCRNSPYEAPQKCWEQSSCGCWNTVVVKVNNTATSGVCVYIYIVHAYICRKCLYIYIYFYLFVCVLCVCVSTYTIYIYILRHIITLELFPIETCKKKTASTCVDTGYQWANGWQIQWIRWTFQKTKPWPV